jgi:hypothetical protein
MATPSNEMAMQAYRWPLVAALQTHVGVVVLYDATDDQVVTAVLSQHYMRL